MSSSFLKPEVTPCTALATSARARPCSARCSSVARVAISAPSFCSNVIPCGTATESFPFGPCTSTLPLCSATFTAEGTGIGLRPMRDISSSLTPTVYILPNWGAACCAPTNRLPDLTKNFAAHFALSRGSAAHNPFRRGQNADAQPAHDRANFVRATVGPRAWPGDALQARDHAAAVRRVLQKDAQQFSCFVFVHQLVGRDVALFLQDARDVRLEFRDGNIDALVFGGRRVAEARQKIGYGIRLHNSPTSSLSRRPGFLRAAPCHENRFGTFEICGCTRARGR